MLRYLLFSFHSASRGVSETAIPSMFSMVGDSQTANSGKCASGPLLTEKGAKSVQSQLCRVQTPK